MAITKKGNKWYVYTYMGKKADGKQDIAWSQGFDSHDDAERHEAKIKLKQAPARQEKIGFGDFMENVWLPSKSLTDKEYADGAIPPKGFIGYKTKEQYFFFIKAFKSHSVAKTALGKLTPLSFEDYKKERLKEVSPGTVTAELKMARQALKAAKRWGMILQNPMDDVALCGSERKTEVTFADVTESQGILRAAKGTKIYAAIAIILGTGLREAEVCGLRIKESLQLDQSRITVNGTTQRQVGGVVIFRPDAAKSKNSLNSLLIDPDLVEVIKKQIIVRDKAKLAAGDAWQDPYGLLFTHEDGRPWAPDYLYKAFTKLLKQSGFAHLTVHELRHSHATILRDRGVPMEVISDRLRHYNSSFTHRLYAHKTPATEAAAVAAISGLISGVTG